ncbi:membrane anchor subunit of succinate dehydrogenase, Sdh4 [Basidiobolus ranarum]|uniref:Succinate dehydrogenase [ubiquinone] cytochrome b small subunit n=1 Tax=Basidiobolus ranarum TaxID=34480 RepID=A0ABR2WCG5_9FUNG
MVHSKQVTGHIDTSASLKCLKETERGLVSKLFKFRNIPVPYKNADGITVYPPDYMHGSYHWVFERAISISLLPLLTYPCIFGSHPIVDFTLGFVIPIHCHIGFGACIEDYVPARKFPRANRASVIGLRLATVGVMYGCYELNTCDIGITETVMKLWTA